MSIGTVLAKWLFLRKVAGVNVPDPATSFLAMSRELVDEVNLFNDKARHLCGYLAWLSYVRHASIPVERVPRRHGRSKYTVWRLIKLTVTLVTHYTNAPLALRPVVDRLNDSILVFLGQIVEEGQP